ncbi:hypothetical protein QR680_018804 [Steinernema hermaphroditum]|uniref:Chitin-binding type-2 domain-containing protein n=1 Tax=Steinernema hermaphroditum TaxID=289476 RepID=A0AA39HK03_9BILA|nr:hypothetical protein QR680_018804 [Steinernema hermaphroditum]
MRLFLVAAIGALIVLSVSLTLGGVIPQDLDEETTDEPGPSQPDYHCEADGYFPDPKSCQGFYRCIHNKPYHFKCGNGTYFNPNLHNCDWPGNVDCKAE